MLISSCAADLDTGWCTRTSSVLNRTGSKQPAMVVSGYVVPYRESDRVADPQDRRQKNVSSSSTTTTRMQSKQCSPTSTRKTTATHSPSSKRRPQNLAPRPSTSVSLLSARSNSSPAWLIWPRRSLSFASSKSAAQISSKRRQKHTQPLMIFPAS